MCTIINCRKPPDPNQNIYNRTHRPRIVEDFYQHHPTSNIQLQMTGSFWDRIHTLDPGPGPAPDPGEGVGNGVVR